jgi:hypothetical protein
VAFGALSWPVGGAAGTQIDITVATLGALTNGPYTMVALTKPKASRGATLAAKVAGTIRREMIIDTNSLYGSDDFTGFTGMVAGDWHWIGQSKPAGTAPYTHWRRDITAGGAIASSAVGSHPEFAAATSLALGQGDNESRDDHALIAVWLRELTPTELGTIFNPATPSVVPVLALAPDALWAGNVPAPAAVRDITGHGNNPSGVAGPGSIVPADGPPGMDWATFFTDAEAPPSETFDPATVAVEFTVPAGTLYRARAWFPALASGTTPLFRLYDSGGALVASGSWDSLVDDNWNWYTPPAPIHLAAGTYRLARYTSRYTYTAGLLAAPITRNGVTANRGMFASGADAVPNTPSTVWFGLDWEFIPDATGTPVTVADTSGGSSAGGQADAVAVATAAASGGSSGGGQADAAALEVAGAGGGSSASGQADVATYGVTVAGASSGSSTGGQADDISASSGAVTIMDTSGGASAGGTPETSAPTVKRDTMVMPILQAALAALRTEASFTEVPPGRYHIRTGTEFENQADRYGRDECCDGIGWARLVANYEGDDSSWIDPATSPRNCAPVSWAVVLELGLMRCIPMAANDQGDPVTDEQWVAAAQAQLDDGAALRRTLCDLRELYDGSDVVAGQISPLPNTGGCSGVTLQVTIRANACDC